MTAIPRFFVDPAAARLAAGAEIDLPPPVARHAIQVLRLRDDACIVVFDGRGGEYPARLVVHGRHALARLGDHASVERESPAPVVLVQAIVAGDVMDAIVRKAVELGVDGVVPVVSARTQRAPAERVERRHERWRQIALAACEQCGRNRVPPVASPVTLEQWVGAQPDLRDAVVLDPGAVRTLEAQVRARAPRFVLTGPEGGWTVDEVAQAQARGARPALLGARVLRADTAALAALAIVDALARESCLP